MMHLIATAQIWLDSCKIVLKDSFRNLFTLIPEILFQRISSFVVYMIIA